MNVLWSSECDLRGSGYWGITSNIGTHLVGRGHNLVVVGHEYKNQPHDFPFTIVRSDLRVLRSQIEMIKQAQWPDAAVFSWDIPAQKQLTEWFAKKGVAPYVGIFPVEAPPLKEIEEWVGYIREMDVALCISEFGTRECEEAGLTNVTFLPVGIDHEFWKPPTEEYREDLRRDLGLTDKFVIITVADNHLRKNLAAGLQILVEVLKERPDAHYLLISRPHARFIGWSFKELGQRYGVEDHITIVHSRPTNEMLLRFYQASDAYLCTSHAEGLGLPILEAQACGVPVVAGDWTAMTELLTCGKGLLVGADFSYVDPFGNQNRHFISVREATEALLNLATDRGLSAGVTKRALEFVATRTYGAASDVFLRAVEAVL